MVISVSLPSPSKFSDFQHLCIAGKDRKNVLGRSAASQGTAKQTGSVSAVWFWASVSFFSSGWAYFHLHLCHYSSKMSKVYVSLSGTQNDVMIKVLHTVYNVGRDLVCVKK